jgi:hypothetical protein
MITKVLVKTFGEKKIFDKQKFLLKTNFVEVILQKLFAKTQFSRKKKNVAKICSFSLRFPYSWKLKNSFSFQP